MNEAILLLGSNLGNRADYLQQAICALEKRVGRIQKRSSVYESAPWGFVADTQFLNQALLVATDLQPLPLLAATQAIERELGRVHNAQNGYTSRCIDIDILFFNHEIIAEPRLEIPHPRLHLRRFALMPLVEILPDFEHPILKKTLRELLRDCLDANEAVG